MGLWVSGLQLIKAEHNREKNLWRMEFLWYVKLYENGPSWHFALNHCEIFPDLIMSKRLLVTLTLHSYAVKQEERESTKAAETRFDGRRTWLLLNRATHFHWSDLFTQQYIQVDGHEPTKQHIASNSNTVSNDNEFFTSIEAEAHINRFARLIEHQFAIPFYCLVFWWEILARDRHRPRSHWNARM